MVCTERTKFKFGRSEKLEAGLGITSEQLIKRFVAEGLAAIDPKAGEAVPGENLEDFLVRNEVLKPRSNEPS